MSEIIYQYFSAFRGEIFIYDGTPGLRGVPTVVGQRVFLERMAKDDFELAGIIPGKEHRVIEHSVMDTWIMKKHA